MKPLMGIKLTPGIHLSQVRCVNHCTSSPIIDSNTMLTFNFSSTANAMNFSNLLYNKKIFFTLSPYSQSHSTFKNKQQHCIHFWAHCLYERHPKQSLKQDNKSHPSLKQDNKSHPFLKQDIKSHPSLKQDNNSFMIQLQKVTSTDLITSNKMIRSHNKSHNLTFQFS